MSQGKTTKENKQTKTNKQTNKKQTNKQTNKKTHKKKNTLIWSDLSKFFPSTCPLNLSISGDLLKLLLSKFIINEKSISELNSCILQILKHNC